jgi:hypothetical protein
VSVHVGVCVCVCACRGMYYKTVSGTLNTFSKSHFVSTNPPHDIQGPALFPAGIV